MTKDEAWEVVGALSLLGLLLAFLGGIAYDAFLVAPSAVKGPSYCIAAIKVELPGTIDPLIVSHRMWTRQLDDHWVSAVLLSSRDLETRPLTAVCHFASTNFTRPRIELHDGDRRADLEDISLSILDPRSWYDDATHHPASQGNNPFLAVTPNPRTGAVASAVGPDPFALPATRSSARRAQTINGVFLGSVTNDALPTTPSNLRLTFDNRRSGLWDGGGDMVIFPPLSGSGQFDYSLRGDSLSILSYSARGDMILWTARMAADHVTNGTYRIVGGHFAGQAGIWTAVALREHVGHDTPQTP